MKQGRRSRNVTVHQRKIHEDEDIGSSPLFGPIPLTGPPPSYSGFIGHRKIAASLYSPRSRACTSCHQDLLTLFRAPSGRCICRRGISGIGGHSAGNCRRCLARCHKCWSPRHLSQCHWVCDLLVAVRTPTIIASAAPCVNPIPDPTIYKRRHPVARPQPAPTMSL